MVAWILLDHGYRVTILAKEWAWTKDWWRFRLTSQIAGALWEFPPGGCGLTEIESPESGWAAATHYQEWAKESYEFYKVFNLHPRYKSKFGMNFIELNQFFYNKPNKEDEISKEDYQKLQQVKYAFSKKWLNHLNIQDTG